LLQFTLVVVVIVGAGVTVQPLLLFFSFYFVLIAFSDSSRSDSVVFVVVVVVGASGLEIKLSQDYTQLKGAQMISPEIIRMSTDFVRNLVIMEDKSMTMKNKNI